MPMQSSRLLVPHSAGDIRKLLIPKRLAGSVLDRDIERQNLPRWDSVEGSNAEELAHMRRSILS